MPVNFVRRSISQMDDRDSGEVPTKSDRQEINFSNSAKKVIENQGIWKNVQI